MKIQRISHTHLQSLQPTLKAKIAKEYVLPTLKAGREEQPVANKM